MAEWITNPKNNQQYRIANRARGYFHVYKDGRVVKMGGPRPKGFNQFNEKNRQWYKNADDGYTAQHVYSNGRKVNMGPGSVVRSMGDSYSPYYKTAEALTKASVDTPVKTLQAQQDNERNAQNAAYGKVAGYYAGLGENAKGLMGQVGQVGQQTDQSLQQIGADRQAQIRSNTPQFQGPMGQIAQTMVDREQQAALNRGSAEDATNRAYSTNVSGSRQALAGGLGAAQQQTGTEKLAYLRGLGQQALDPYSTKIAELKGSRGGKLIDTMVQLQQAGASQAVAGAKADAAQTSADAALIRANDPGSSGGGGSSDKPSKPKGPHTMTQINKFWGDITKARGFGRSHTYDETVAKYGETIAATARSLELKGGITPYAASLIKKDGYGIGTRYKVLSHG